MANFALNKITGIIVTVLILLVAVGYTTNSFSQTPSGNTTTICDPDERFDENLQECISIIPSNGNNDTDDSIKLCDPGEVLDTVSNICHEPCEPGQTFNPATRICSTDPTDITVASNNITSRPNVTINTNLDIVIKSSGNIIVLPMETGPGPDEPLVTGPGPDEPLVTGPGPETEPQ